MWRNCQWCEIRLLAATGKSSLSSDLTQAWRWNPCSLHWLKLFLLFIQNKKKIVGFIVNIYLSQIWENLQRNYNKHRNRFIRRCHNPLEFLRFWAFKCSRLCSCDITTVLWAYSLTLRFRENSALGTMVTVKILICLVMTNISVIQRSAQTFRSQLIKDVIWS